MTVVWGIFSLHYEYVCSFAVLLIMYTPIKKTWHKFNTANKNEVKAMWHVEHVLWYMYNYREKYQILKILQFQVTSRIIKVESWSYQNGR